MKNRPLSSLADAGAVATPPDWLPLLHALARSYQAFDHLSERNLRRLKLTGPQFDIIATLGNTGGMSCKELGQRTLITKGTLTGVLDRLEGKALIRRIVSNDDRRALVVSLTPEGQRCFERIFPEQMAFLDLRLRNLDHLQCEQLVRLLNSLRRVLEDKV